MSEPVRTCVGCRERAPQEELLRVTLCDGSLRPDPRRRLGGRGAYLHPQESCIDQAIRRRTLARALRGNLTVTPDAAELRAAYAKPRDKA